MMALAIGDIIVALHDQIERLSMKTNYCECFFRSNRRSKVRILTVLQEQLETLYRMLVDDSHKDKSTSPKARMTNKQPLRAYLV